MIPSRLQGKPSYDLSSSKYKPFSKIIAPNPLFEITAVNKATNKKVKDEYIPSPIKSIGIETNQYEMSLGCREVNDLNTVYFGNTLAQLSYLNAAPPNPLNKDLITDDRYAIFGANFKQTPISNSTFA